MNPRAHMRPTSSLSKRRMENFNQYKTKVEVVQILHGLCKHLTLGLSQMKWKNFVGWKKKKKKRSGWNGNMPLSPSSLGLSHHTFRRSWSRVLIQNAEDLGPQPSMHVQYAGWTLMIGGNKACRPVCESEKSFSAEIKKGMTMHLQICSRGMSSRHPSIFLFISSRVLTWPAMWNRSFAVPQYCSMKFNSQWYLG